jgi:hypothetical protein
MSAQLWYQRVHIRCHPVESAKKKKSNNGRRKREVDRIGDLFLLSSLRVAMHRSYQRGGTMAKSMVIKKVVGKERRSKRIKTCKSGDLSCSILKRRQLSLSPGKIQL